MKINEKNLCVFATTPPYDIEGFLSKRGEVNRAFQRRYFVLKGNLLFYFDRRGDREPQGLIIVEGCTIELSEEVDNYCFEIAFNGNRTYVLCAETQETMEAWMKALTCAGYEYKRIIVAELQRQLEEIEEARNKIPGVIMLQTNAVPKPPPRQTRINPFNRPAPPPPSEINASQQQSQSQGQGQVVMPFINGHFGSSRVRQQQEQQQRVAAVKIENGNGNGNGSPHHTPKPPRRSNAIAGRSEFFVDQQAAEVPTVLARSNRINNNYSQDSAAQQMQRRLKVVEDFERKHEHVRQDIMRDIIEYRVKKQPLIEL